MRHLLVIFMIIFSYSLQAEAIIVSQLNDNPIKKEKSQDFPLAKAILRFEEGEEDQESGFEEEEGDDETSKQENSIQSENSEIISKKPIKKGGKRKGNFHPSYVKR